MTRPRAIDRAAVDRAVLAAAAIVLACQPLFAQTYGVSRAAIAGGGGTSSAGSFTVTGTIGQPESGAPMAGGTYEVTGGFWSFAGTDPCAFSIAPTARTIAGAGGSDTVTVTLAATTSICPWTATA